jgi:hypothetical protein
VGILKMLAVLIAALVMAAFESVRPGRAKDEDDVALLLSDQPLPEAGSDSLEQTF